MGRRLLGAAVVPKLDVDALVKCVNTKAGAPYFAVNQGAK